LEPTEVRGAVAAARSVAEDVGLRADDAIVLHNSNRIAVRLTPCDALARVGPPSYEAGLAFEVEVGRRIAETGAPVCEPDPRTEPRVHVSGGFAVTLWTYHEPLPPMDIAPAEYTDALARLHAGMREVDVESPHFTDRVGEAERLLAEHEQTPDLPDADRELLSRALRRLSGDVMGAGTAVQLLHGEPHLGNVLRTEHGLRFVDLETCCRGPVEFDIAHALLPNDDRRTLTVEELSEHYPGASRDAIERSFVLIWAMITTWRWRHDDELPNSAHWRVEGLAQLRRALDRAGLDLGRDDG
jgi:hypothetical protein